MAAWTRTEDADYITYVRSDGEAGYRINKAHPHFHAEQWMPWDEAPPQQGTTHSGTDSWFRSTLEVNDDTVTG